MASSNKPFRASPLLIQPETRKALLYGTAQAVAVPAMTNPRAEKAKRLYGK